MAGAATADDGDWSFFFQPQRWYRRLMALPNGRTILATGLPEGAYINIASLTNGNAEALPAKR